MNIIAFNRFIKYLFCFLGGDEMRVSGRVRVRGWLF